MFWYLFIFHRHSPQEPASIACIYRQGSSSNWILMSCQPHRVTSGQSISGHKQLHISKLLSYIYQPSSLSSQSTKTNHFANIEHNVYTNIRHKFSELVPSILPLLKEHIRLGHAGNGIVDHSVSFIDTRLKKNIKIGMERHNIKLK